MRKDILLMELENNDHLQEALELLNMKLELNGGNKLYLNVCGGFAISKWTSAYTRDIDNTNQLSQDIKKYN